VEKGAKMKLLATLVTTTLLCACATNMAEAPRSGSTRSLDVAAMKEDGADHPTGRSYLLPGAPYVSADGHPNAIILLSRDTSKSRRTAACEAFLRTPTVEAIQQDNPGAHVLRMFWPVSRQVAADARCADLVAAYDYDRAQAIASRFQYPGKQGPAVAIVQGPQQNFLIDLASANASTINNIVSTWVTVAAERGANGEAYYKVPGAGGGSFGKAPDIACALMSVAGAAGVPVVNLAGQLICKKPA
jgi:hypothetical protein